MNLSIKNWGSFGIQPSLISPRFHHEISVGSINKHGENITELHQRRWGCSPGDVLI